MKNKYFSKIEYGGSPAGNYERSTIAAILPRRSRPALWRDAEQPQYPLRVFIRLVEINGAAQIANCPRPITLHVRQIAKRARFAAARFSVNIPWPILNKINASWQGGLHMH